MSEVTHYYVPPKSHWPIVAAIGLILTVIGVVHLIHDTTPSLSIFIAGIATLFFMMYGWFGDVIRESMSGKYSAQLDKSFRLGMCWFIFSEVMFFAAFFGVLFYVTTYAVPWLGGIGAKGLAGKFLWPNFHATWPLFKNPSAKIQGPSDIINAWGVPALNTLILLSSGVTITWAHWALKKNNRSQLNLAMTCTITLGLIFLALQMVEYHEAYTELNLTLHSGIYGSTFFMLTGFHGFHVTIGTIMLIVILIRCLKGHFTPEKHFAFEAVAWYWHFVDFVWLGLFIMVYWRPKFIF